MDINVKDTKTKGQDVDWDKLFLFNGKLYDYYLASYNNTFSNERAIEIPIIIDYIRKTPSQNILEIGNVLSYYFGNVAHDVVDLKETSDKIKIINSDIAEYKTDKLYDLIISISTMEHVGFEGDGRFKLTPGHLKKGFDNVRNLLSKSGKFVFTVPLGYNPELDDALVTDKIKMKELYCMESGVRANVWKQIDFKSIKRKPWNNFVQNLVNVDGEICACRRVKYIIVGVIYG